MKRLTLILCFFHVAIIAQGQEPVQTIAFGSCLKESRPQPIWESVIATNPNVFVLLGDNIYGDTRDMAKLKAKWHVFEEKPGFRKLRGNCRILGIWDDHDYGENDAGIEYPKKIESQQIFLDFLGEPKDSIRRKTPGTYDAVTIGPKGKRVQFILLDTRYFRTALKRAQNEKKAKVPMDRMNRTRQRYLAKHNGGGWRKHCTSRRRSASSHLVFKSFQRHTVGKPGETSLKKGDVSLSYSRKPRPTA